MNKTKRKEYNQAHYEQNSDELKEKARLRRVEAKQEKTFAELLKEFADNIQIAETNYLQTVVDESGISPYKLAEIYKKLRVDMKLTEHQRLHIHNNAPVKKLLRQRLEQQQQVSELL
ncbi:hypothetical protein LTQ03_15685 [Vibrio splendidus]|uniref:hypothetical protein n=1 Tax=Vibrio splendidus TaxID=29497 RepID=UPI001FB2722E|nr:hypothetical protein [Vibrio splendidus]UOE82170.1 hypothetical protein LTQ03_15685 [Vibrio splendidus]